MSQDAKVCSACGLPPRQSVKTGKTLPLRRCSVCQNAWYHDVECQRKHFPGHRRQCRKQRVASASTDTQYKTPFHIENLEGRGRCLVASRSISVGEPIAPERRSEFFDPLVPPVLTENARPSRCALCFRLLTEEVHLTYNENKHFDKYPVLFCSNQCRDRGKSWIRQEERTVVMVCSRIRQCQTVMPTAILLYRILCKIAFEESREEGSVGPKVTVRSRIDDLQFHKETDMTADTQDHARAVVAFATELILATAQSSTDKERQILSGFAAEDMREILSKMKTNCFTICDGESVGIGLGLYPIASNMNHSCQPNAIQTFMYGDYGSLPLLRITACSAIQPDEEICISYIDSTCPRYRRRQLLREGYNFLCDCQNCADDEKDSSVVGLRCPNVGCDGTGRGQPSLCADNDEAWKCGVCGETDFPSVNEITKEVTLMRLSDRSFQDHSSHKYYYHELENVYARLKSLCTTKSWYVREAGERLLQSYLDSISSCQSETETREVCALALNVAEEMLSSYASTDVTGWVASRVNILRYKAAKLRLFLYPDPRQALMELHNVHKELSLYFPEKHELLEGLKLCIEESSK